MKRLLAFVALLGIVVGARWLGVRLPSNPAADTVMVLGFVLFGAYLAGEVAAMVKLPRITGYLVAGTLFGPHLLPRIHPRLELLSTESVDALGLIDDIALGLIAFTAGGELRISALRDQWKGVLGIAAARTFCVLLGVGGCLMLLAGQFELFADLNTSARLALCILFGTIAVAKSPATTIAVINEYNAEGRVTSTVLGVTVIKDVVVVILFALALPWAKVLMSDGGDFDTGLLFLHLREILGSIAAGALLGGLLALYIKFVNRELGLIVLTVAFLAMVLANAVHLSGLLICMIAGFVVENFSDHGEELIKAVERHSMPVYIVFFTLAGAGLDLDALAATWELALLLAVLRLVFTIIGSYLGAHLAGETREVKRYAWMGFLGQAGLTLSFAGTIAEDFPGELGTKIYTVLIAVVAINQVIGPAFFRYGLAKAGEIRIEKDAPQSGQRGVS